MFQNLKVSTRLFMGFGIVIAIMVAIVLTGVNQMQVMDTATGNVNRSSKNVENALRVLDGVNSMRRFQLSAVASTGVNRMKELERVDGMGASLGKLADEVEHYQRQTETKKLAGDMGALIQKYTKGNVEVMRFARENN